MRLFLLTAIAACISLTASAQKGIKNAYPAKNTAGISVDAIDKNWLGISQQLISESQYYFNRQSNATDAYYTYNQKQHIGFMLTKLGYTVSPVKGSNIPPASQQWKTGLHFSKIEKGNQSINAGNQLSVTQNKAALNFSYPSFEIAYTNDTNGMRQNFIVSKKLPGSGNLAVLLDIEGTLSASVVNNGLCLKDKDSVARLYYKDLVVWDANHQPLVATMELRNKNRLAIVVKDQKAVYPITIDPITQTPEWASSANSLLPSLVGQLAMDAAYGFSAAGLGDVNSDGYDDVAIGAPAMVDLISGTGTMASVGAVFIYYGSSNGLPVIPSAKLQPTTTVAGALFGYSIAGGDVNNDGHADIIVGAPLDNVSISIGGGSTASGTVGKVYVFNGANLSTSTTPFLSVQLSGSGILENGINLSVKALFGFSVAVTEDLNGDGKKDMIVGAPAYAGVKTGLLGVHLLDVQSGGAFVFLTNAANNNLTLSKLEPTKTTILGLGLLSSNINGLLFGYSVDGLGDYNGDGKPDVVATAPAGVDLSSLTALLNGKLLQGSAIVYYGNGAGVDLTSGVTLAATSGGLLSNLVGSVGNVANLFGLSVKGVRNAGGMRNGNVLVGAPLGGAITNILSLQLKTGTVSVFKKQSSSPSGYVAPDQVISSPRNNNSILGLIQTNLLFGFSLDNVFDVNCDGIGDFVVGEPASSGVQLINTSIAGGAAYVYMGKADGTYQPTPGWTLTVYEDAFLGANAASLVGYSVAGAGKVKGAASNNRVLSGSPARSLDFGSGLLNLGNTLGTLFSLAALDNGIGKAYAFDPGFCYIVLDLMDLELAGKCKDGTSYLTWTGAKQLNNSRFEIERSNNNMDFKFIGQVAGKSGSNSTINYHFNDANLSNDNNYYRLKIIDNNGLFKYSNTIALNQGSNKNKLLNIHPIPFDEHLIITISSKINDPATIRVFDITGTLLIKQKCIVRVGTNNIMIDNLGNLAPGFYFVDIKLTDMEYTQRVIK